MVIPKKNGQNKDLEIIQFLYLLHTKHCERCQEYNIDQNKYDFCPHRHLASGGKTPNNHTNKSEDKCCVRELCSAMRMYNRRQHWENKETIWRREVRSEKQRSQGISQEEELRNGEELHGAFQIKQHHGNFMRKLRMFFLCSK